MTTQPTQRPPTIGPKEIANGGVLHPKDLAHFEDDGANVIRNVYSNDNSGKGNSIVIWCLKPGQENSTQWHEDITHIFIIKEGEGIYMKGQPFMAPVECPKETTPMPAPNFKPTMIPIKAGDVIVIPEKTIHGIRNTGKVNLSYTAFGPYSRIDVGPQAPSHRQPGAPVHSA